MTHFLSVHLQPPYSIFCTNFLFHRASHELLSLVLNFVLHGISSYECVQVWWSLDIWAWSWLAEHPFCLLWDIGTPLFSGATYSSRPLPPSLSFPLQLSYSTTAIYIPLVKSIQPASQPDIPLTFSSSKKRNTENCIPFLLPHNSLLLPSCPCKAFAPTPLQAHQSASKAGYSQKETNLAATRTHSNWVIWAPRTIIFGLFWEYYDEWL